MPLQIELILRHPCRTRNAFVEGGPASPGGVLDDETREMLLYRVPYPIESARQKIIAAGLPANLASRLALGR